MTEDWYFYSHRLPIARAAVQAGYEVHLITHLTTMEDRLAREAIVLHKLDLKRGAISPRRDLLSIIRLVKLLRSIRPQILHNVAIKPTIYGTVAARFVGGVSVVNALGGLGYVFTSSSLKARVLRPLISAALRLCLNGRRTRVILQNLDDVQLLTRRRLVNPDRMTLIRGAGVDTQSFRPREFDKVNDPPVVAFAARLLRDKGIYEFTDAVKELRRRGVRARFVLIGSPDPANPSSASASELQAWSEELKVEAWGWSEDMAQTLQETDVVVLPSYREGLPKVLLEAASCGLPIVTTDAPGCRDVVLDGLNGYLVPVRSVLPIVNAIEKLLASRELRQNMGLRGRERVLSEFRVERIVAQTFDLYKSIAAEGS